MDANSCEKVCKHPYGSSRPSYDITTTGQTPNFADEMVQFIGNSNSDNRLKETERNDIVKNSNFLLRDPCYRVSFVCHW